MPGLDAEMTLSIMRSLSDVGPNKPIGYLPLYTIRNFLKLNPKSVASDATARGLVAIRFGAKDCAIKSGALYVYDEAALRNLLLGRQETLLNLGVPINPGAFVAFIAANWLDQDHPARSVIAEAFGERI